MLRGSAHLVSHQQVSRDYTLRNLVTSARVGRSAALWRLTTSSTRHSDGRLICEIGIAPVRPAEFVIFRIGHWTLEARS